MVLRASTIVLRGSKPLIQGTDSNHSMSDSGLRVTELQDEPIPEGRIERTRQTRCGFGTVEVE